MRFHLSLLSQPLKHSRPSLLQFVPNQPLWRIYGEGVSITGQDAATIDNQVAQGLLNQVIKQVSAQQPELTTNTPWRIMGLFPSTCMICRAANVCGPISCADKVGLDCGADTTKGAILHTRRLLFVEGSVLTLANYSGGLQQLAIKSMRVLGEVTGARPACGSPRLQAIYPSTRVDCVLHKRKLVTPALCHD